MTQTICKNCGHEIYKFSETKNRFRHSPEKSIEHNLSNGLKFHCGCTNPETKEDVQ